jgi:hypothetical protein
MNRKEIIRTAWRANGEPAWSGGVEWTWDELEKFASLVAAAEREECAKIASWCTEFELAAAMRARGQQ